MSRRLRLVAGFALASLALATFLWAVGPTAVLAELAGADLPTLGVGFLAVAAALGCWSEAVRRLVGATGHPIGGSRYRRAYLSGEFLKQVIPMGQSGGPVLLSYTVSAETDAPQDAALAAATVFAFLNVVASLVIAAAGLAVLVLTRRGPTGAVLQSTLTVMVAITVGVLAFTLVATYRLSVLERAVVAAAGGLRATVGRLSERAAARLAPDRVTETVDRYAAVVNRLTGDRRAVAAAVGLAVVGWLCFLVPLYTSFLAIDSGVPFTLVLFAVPVVTLLNVVPLPGGLGGFEVALAAVVAALATVDLPTATAAVFLFRLSNYWFIVLLGGLAAASLSVRVGDPPAVLAVDDDETA